MSAEDRYGKANRREKKLRFSGGPIADGRPATSLPDSVGLARPVIAGVIPVVDGGLYPAKGTIGESVPVGADIFTDGNHDLACWVRFRHQDDGHWSTRPMQPLGNDRWSGEIPVDRLGRYRFAIRATVDHFGTWRRELHARADAGQDIGLDLEVGARLVSTTSDRAKGADREALVGLAGDLWASAAAAAEGRIGPGLELAASPTLAEIMARYPDPGPKVTSDAHAVLVGPSKARFSSWYEVFPRSASPDPSRAGTLADVEALLPYVVGMGFDTLYLPPVHPVGTSNRKGRDGAPHGGPADPGSPWAIGSSAGGHASIDPDLGTFGDFDRLAKAAAAVDTDLAMDLAYQCSPDHPWVVEHPEWFRHLPDGSIRCAENPPKRYEDVYPLDFDTSAWRELWAELRALVEFWIGHGVHIFRVDNPHTKPMRFWEWLIPAVKADHPGVIFLAEAFTRPRVMEHLAKLGFDQSYTYFTWRNTKWELESYLTELTRSGMADYFRPNVWPNTPDILHPTLQTGGRSAFVARLLLAATLSSNYGIYGPAFELQEHEPRSPGSEEYLHSEKYEVRHWDVGRTDSLAPLIATVNRARREHPALQQNRTLRFHDVENDQLIAYTKTAPGPDMIMVVVNLDAVNSQAGWVHLDLGALGLDPDRPYGLRDLLTGADYEWSGPHNFVALDPSAPAHLFQVCGKGADQVSSA